MNLIKSQKITTAVAVGSHKLLMIFINRGLLTPAQEKGERKDSQATPRVTALVSRARTDSTYISTPTSLVGAARATPTYKLTIARLLQWLGLRDELFSSPVSLLFYPRVADGGRRRGGWLAHCSR